MNRIKKFDCPICGNPISAREDNTLLCPFCRTAIVAPGKDHDAFEVNGNEDKVPKRSNSHKPTFANNRHTVKSEAIR